METFQESQMVTVRYPRLSRVVRTTALYTLILVPFFRCLFFQTLLYSLPKALFDLASLLSISLSILASEVIVLPR